MCIDQVGDGARRVRTIRFQISKYCQCVIEENNIKKFEENAKESPKFTYYFHLIVAKVQRVDIVVGKKLFFVLK
jgi:hypothetical protein